MTQEKTFRIGVVGLGKMGLLHLGVYNRLPGSEVVAAAEPGESLAEGIGQMETGLRIYRSLEEMVAKEQLDAVILATPVGDHARAIHFCLERGLPFFVEKPLALNATESRDLAAKLSKSHVPHMVGFMSRYIEAFTFAKQIVDSGALGKLHDVSGMIYVGQLFSKGKGWRYDPAVSGGGALLSQGCHLLDLLTWYFGHVKSVSGYTRNLYSERIEDAGHVLLDFKSGLKGWIDCSWSRRFKRTVQMHIEVRGDDGQLEVSDDGVKLYLEEARGEWRKGWNEWNAVDLYKGVPFDVAGPQYTREAQAFLEVLKGERPSPIDAAQGHHVQSVIEAAYRSSRNGGTVEVVGE